MRIHRVLMVLTMLNLGLLIFQLTRSHRVEAQGVAPVLRGRTLEIVDDRGRARAAIKIEPAGKTPDGKAYPETVIFRLIDANGQPSVKLATSEQGAGLSLVGGDDVSYAILKSDLAESSLKLTNKTGREQIIRP